MNMVSNAYEFVLWFYGLRRMSTLCIACWGIVVGIRARRLGLLSSCRSYHVSLPPFRIGFQLAPPLSSPPLLSFPNLHPQGIINMLKKMPNATALERLNELAYHSFKNVDNPKSCIVSIFTTKPKYVSGN